MYPGVGQTLNTLVQQHLNLTAFPDERDQYCPECTGKKAFVTRGVQSQPHLAAAPTLAPHAWSCCMHGFSRRAFPESHVANINMLTGAFPEPHASMPAGAFPP